MLAIAINELFVLLKGVKSIITILFFAGVSLLVAKLYNQYPVNVEGIPAEGGYTLGFTVTLMLFGLMFIFSLSHDVLNREISNRTMRFLVTKTSKNQILLGKVLGVFLFWLVCVTLSLLLICIFSKSFYYKIFFESLAFILYGVTLATLLSSFIPKPGQSMFFGMILSLVFPALGFWSTFTSKPLVKALGYITPHFYMQERGIKELCILLLSSIFLLVSLVLFKRRDV